jgi:hypothetical protein
LPIVQRMRPDHFWEDVARSLNRETGQKMVSWSPAPFGQTGWCARDWLIQDWLPPRLGARRKTGWWHWSPGWIANANTDVTFRDIASQLEAMHERAPRGSSTWAASSLKHLLDRAESSALFRRPRIDVIHPCSLY